MPSICSYVAFAHASSQPGVATRATEAGADTEQLRAWLGDMSIAEWRDRFDATPADILDLLEYTRARRGGLMRALLEEGEATIDVLVDAPFAESRPTSIDEEPGERPTAYVIRDAETRETLGRVPTRVHADVDALLRTGLPLTTELRLTTLTVRLLEE